MPDLNSTLNTLINTAEAFVAAGLGALITIWAKRKEFGNISENFRLQKEIFEENKKNSINQHTIELSKLQDLKNKFDFSKTELDFKRYERLIEIARQVSSEDNPSKKEFLYDLRELIALIENDFEENFDYPDEPEPVEIAPLIFAKAQDIFRRLNILSAKYPHVFIETMNKLEEIKIELGLCVKYISNESAVRKVTIDNVVLDEAECIVEFYNRIRKYYNDARDEYGQMEKVIKTYISEHYNNKINDLATT